MSKYKIGDRIRHRISGETGTIRLIDSTSVPYGIEFDNEIQGLHNLQGTCKNGHGLWVSEEDIESLAKPLEEYTDEQLKNELDKREREKVKKELRKYIPYPNHNHEFNVPNYSFELSLVLDDNGFELYCKDKSIEDLCEELEDRKTNKISDLINTIDSALNKLNDLGYKVPCGDNQYIRNLGYNSCFDTIMLFTLPKEDDK